VVERSRRMSTSCGDRRRCGAEAAARRGCWEAPASFDTNSGAIRHSPPNIAGLDRAMCARRLRQRSASARVARIENDVNLAAVGEHWRGQAAQDAEVLPSSRRTRHRMGGRLTASSLAAPAARPVRWIAYTAARRAIPMMRAGAVAHVETDAPAAGIARAL